MTSCPFRRKQRELAAAPAPHATHALTTARPASSSTTTAPVNAMLDMCAFPVTSRSNLISKRTDSEAFQRTPRVRVRTELILSPRQQRSSGGPNSGALRRADAQRRIGFCPTPRRAAMAAAAARASAIACEERHRQQQNTNSRSAACSLRL
ncbi:Os06g0161850 [Oryza sativa Japonica Group]|uniref:Os06g0161850 protein n=2 Tax=Oryza sativa subsp. japonica TaxID=39947 RepID=Q5WA98_ORYSJ|nr:hypothetical protein [Oryza sativa Japonica Group]BAS96295.1 Os06g0161850 [Oryza sativa Japonica Group]